MQRTIAKVKERPILFSTPMVKAILEGRKTQTRRIIKMPSWGVGWEYFETDGETARVASRNGCVAEILCPYGQKSDRLWVRETWRHAMSDTHRCFCYKADNKYQCGKDAPTDYQPDWKPSIHMPKIACRLYLEITDIKVQRLQDITEEEAIAEGIEVIEFDDETMYRNYSKFDICLRCPIASFCSLWQSINGVESWEENPWIWKIAFTTLEPQSPGTDCSSEPNSAILQ